ncbi:MAG: TonB-dependent receptor [Verrucomicrobia bacterium]|nr:TonB-dependent receptor [Verrucomicrobiota bacterium]
MKNTLGNHRRIASIFVVVLGWLLTTAGLFSQPAATGTIQGRVYNPASQEYVRNAEVRLDATNQVTYTENDGSFQFANVPAGTAAITVTYTGYNTVKESFTVTAGQPSVREINLISSAALTPTKSSDGVVQLAAFTVSSEREGNSKAIMDQRRNMNISTSVSSDIFGDVTDGNVGEFLKYLPGVDIDYVESEARGPRLGGMEGQYVGVSFDGLRTASADANRGGGDASRATSFEGFSITAIESIEVSRTTSPESDADSPAGTINMKTKRAFDRKGRHYGFNTSLNFNDEEFTLSKTYGPTDKKESKVKPNYELNYAEAFMGQRLGILLSASHAESYTEQYISRADYQRTPNANDPRPLVVRQLFFKDGPKFILKDSLLLTADFKATPRLVLSFNAMYTYTEGEFWNRSFTWVASNDNSNATVANGRASVGGDGLLNVVATRVSSGSTATSKTNNVATVNNGDGSASKLTYTRTFAPRFEYKVDSWLVDGAASFSRSVNNYEALERAFISSEGGGVASSWTATRPHAESWEWTIRQTSGPDWFDLHSFTNNNARNGGTRADNSTNLWVTEIWSGQLNAKWVLPIRKFPVSLKFGGKWNEENRDNRGYNNTQIWSYIGPNGNTVRVNPTTGAIENVTYGNWANVGPQFVSPHAFDMGTTNALTVYNINGEQGMPPRVNRYAVADLFHAHPEQFVNTATPENYYTDYYASPRFFRQTVKAGYTQFDARPTSKLQVRFGVRLEETENAVREFDPLLRAQVLAAGYAVYAANTNGGRAQTLEGLRYQFESQPRITRHSSYRNWFPSVTAKYNILRNFEFHTGFNKGISRPPIDNLTGLWVVDEVNSRVSAPNPALLPEFTKKYQARLAYYFSGRSPGQLTVDLSQTEITNLRETFDYSAAEFGVDDPDFSGYTFRATRNSANMRKFRTMEWSYNQTLGFLPYEVLRGIGYNVAYTRAYASERRGGLSPHRVSSRLSYSYKKFSGSLGMVWRPDTPSDTGVYGRFASQLTQFDLSLNWKLNSRLTTYIQGRNITSMPVLWYESPTGSVEGQNRYLREMQKYGANWVLGLRGQF